MPPITPSILSNSTSSSTASAKQEINLLRGWPSASLHPTAELKNAARKVLSDEELSTVALSYGPDPGYQKLREEVAVWLGNFYGSDPKESRKAKAERICISGVSCHFIFIFEKGV